jgi:tetratricopeptide (TPR) repeat protein
MRYKDVDESERANKLRAFSYSLLITFVSMGASILLGAGIFLGLAVGVMAGGIAYSGSLFLAERSGRVAASIYQPSGSSTPPIREYSLADSLVASGRFDEAAEAYQVLSEDYPQDPEPRLRHARLVRDKTRCYEDALSIFKSALAISSLKPETELAILRELVELCTHKLHQPARALPYLARIAEKFPGTPTGEWARNESREIKRQIQEDLQS